MARHCQVFAHDAPLAPDCPYTLAEVDWLVRSEFVETLSDVILRRTAMAITGGVSMEVIEAVADVMMQARGFGPADMARQQTTLIEELAEYHGVTPEALTARNKERSRECVLAAKPA